MRGALEKSACARLAIACFLIAGLATTTATSPARAVIRYGDFELSGNFETQNILRTPDIGEIEFIQNRNTMRLRVDWHLLKSGRLVDKFDLPFIKDATLLMIYRGVYDGFYDLAPGGNQTGQSRFDDLIGGPIEGNQFGTCRDPVTGAKLSGSACRPGSLLREGAYSRLTRDARSSLKRESVLREVFVDFSLRDAPLSFRLGRQQIVWGEADQFRLADIWNPLDVSWRFPIGDTFDEFRVPLWLGKGIWDIGSLDMGPLGEFHGTFLEVVYNPFDFQPGQKVDWLPRPHSLPFPNPLREGQIQVSQPIPGGPNILVSPRFDLGGTSFKRGDFSRSPESASEIGARIHSVSPGGIEWTVNYIYGRGKWLANSPALGVRVKRVTPNVSRALGTFNGMPVVDTVVEAEVVHPYNHIFGFTGNFFDSTFTNAVLRWEAAYAMGEPYATIDESKLIEVIPGVRSPVGFTKRDVTAFMVGFDRPTWIRWLNRKSTWFITTQLFTVHIPGRKVGKLRGFGSALRSPYFNGPFESTEGFGVWDSCTAEAESEGRCFTGLTERVQDARFRPSSSGDFQIAGKPPGDNVKKWEFMWTFAAQSTYRGGSVTPLFITLFDPINLWIAPQLEINFLYTSNLILTLQERVIIPMDPPTNDPWFVGRFGRRSETALRLTYQF